MKDKKYPDSVYDGITSNPKTWGMCCSEEMARLCAEEHFDREQLARKNRNAAAINAAVYIALIGLVFLISKLFT